MRLVTQNLKCKIKRMGSLVFPKPARTHTQINHTLVSVFWISVKLCFLKLLSLFTISVPSTPYANDTLSARAAKIPDTAADCVCKQVCL